MSEPAYKTVDDIRSKMDEIVSPHIDGILTAISKTEPTILTATLQALLETGEVFPDIGDKDPHNMAGAISALHDNMGEEKGVVGEVINSIRSAFSTPESWEGVEKTAQHQWNSINSALPAIGKQRM